MTCSLCGMDQPFPRGALNLAVLYQEAHALNCPGGPNVLTRPVRRELERRQAKIEKKLA